MSQILRIWCKLILSNMSTFIGVSYYTTSPTAFSEIASHNNTRKACSMNDCFIICCDFTHNSIDWNVLHACCDSQEFLDMYWTVF